MQLDMRTAIARLKEVKAEAETRVRYEQPVAAISKRQVQAQVREARLLLKELAPLVDKIPTHEPT